MTHTIHWFEIPTQDLSRAERFYEQMLGQKFRRESFGGMDLAIFVRDGEGSVTGALVRSENMRPGPAGTIVYLNARRDLDGCVERAVRAGGRVILPQTDIGDPGFIALVADTEGNTVGLHTERS